MKKIISALVCFMLCIVSFVGCGSKSKAERILYNSDITKYVKLGDYKNLPVDESSDTIKEYYDDIAKSDVESKKLYKKKTEGTVEKGDTVNIDYTGKKDGVAFDGGTATGYDLEIGSNSFIAGFEDGLIGATIGDTVDLNLTFPEDYQSIDLAGKAVVFTVKINYVTSSEAMDAQDYYKEFNFDSLDEYEKDVRERAVKKYLVDTVKKNSKIQDYPSDDLETLYSANKTMISNNIKSSYGVDLDTYLKYNNQTEDDFKSSLLDKQIKPMMEEQLVLYAILDKENLGLTKDDVNNKLDETVKQYDNSNITSSALNSYYGDYYFEYLTVNDTVSDYLYKNAKIKK